jgi:multiple sugar transport system ATP-binding protein
VSVNGDSGSVTIGSQTLNLDASVLSARPGLRNYDGKQVVLGIRPEDFEDAAMVEHDTTGRQLTSTISLIEALGSELMVHFDLAARTVDSGDPDVVEEAEGASNAVGRFNPRSKVRMRQPVTVAVATENLHFFDSDTRLSIWE